jgi:CubicO group peptidase (beta-lactamase class C family)
MPPHDNRPTDRSGADLSNWRTAPYNEWAFQHVADLIPTAVIANAPQNVLRLGVERRSLDGFRLPTRGGSALGLEDFLRVTRTDAFVVLLDGRIVYEYYDHGMTARTPHILMSATKSVIGLVAGILSGRGELDVAAAVSNYIPEIADTHYRDATIRHLLDMRTGVDFDDRATLAYQAATGWEPAAEGRPAHGLHAFFAGMAASGKPHGGAFRYVTANTDLLGWAMERATGHPLIHLVSELLWKPLGAEDAAYITLDREGAPRSTGGLCSTILDFARLGQLLIDDGVRGSVVVVPRNWIEDIHTNGDRGAWVSGEFAAGFPGMAMRYRSHWYVIDDAPQTIFAMGIHGQNLFVDRANRLVVAKMSSQDAAIDSSAIALTQRAVRQVRRCLVGGYTRDGDTH